MGKVNIRFLEPSLLTWEDVTRLAGLIVRVKDFGSLERLLDRLPGIVVEYVNPLAPDAEVMIEPARVVQMSLDYEPANSAPEESG